MKSIRRAGKIVFISLVMALVFVPVAIAGKFHFRDLNIGLGNSLVLTGDLVGLGNDVAEVRLIATGFVTAMCENKGGNQAPGRNPISVEVTQDKYFVRTDSNGWEFVEVSVPDPTADEYEPSPTPKEAGCPNGNWQVVDIIDGSTDWTAAQVLVYEVVDPNDPSENILRIDLSFTCTTIFENGLAVSVTCVEA